MIRVLENLLLFLLPFLLYAGWLAATRRSPFLRRNWSQHPVMVLTGIGAVLFVVGLIAFGGVLGRDPDAPYVPAHMEQGRLVPGQVSPKER